MTRHGPFWYGTYARWVDGLVILVYADRRHDWLLKAVYRRVQEDLTKLGIPVNEGKSRVVDLERGETFTFLRFEFRQVRKQESPMLETSTPGLRWRELESGGRQARVGAWTPSSEVAHGREQLGARSTALAPNPTNLQSFATALQSGGRLPRGEAATGRCTQR